MYMQHPFIRRDISKDEYLKKFKVRKKSLSEAKQDPWEMLYLFSMLIQVLEASKI